MTTSPVTEQTSERRHERSIALLTAGAALAGVLLGGVPTYIVTRVQTSAAASQDRADFSRTQRQQAYADFVDQAQQLDDELEQTTVTLDNSFTRAHVDLHKQFVRMRDLNRALDHSGATLQLVGSSKVSDLMMRVRLSSGQATQSAINMALRSHSTPRNKAYAKYEIKEKAFRDVLTDLIDAAREDLGSND